MVLTLEDFYGLRPWRDLTSRSNDTNSYRSMGRIELERRLIPSKQEQLD